MEMLWNAEMEDGLFVWKSGAYKVKSWTVWDGERKIRLFAAVFTGAAGYLPSRLNDRPLVDIDQAKRLCADHLDLMRIRLDKIQ